MSVLIKNKPYDKYRISITGTNGLNSSTFFCESSGVRFYTNEISSTQSLMESVTFNAFLSFTSSNTTNWEFDLVPMQPETSCIIETNVLGLKSDGTKGFLMKSFGGYRKSNSSLSVIGGSFEYTYRSDFTGATAYFTASGTSSVNLVVKGTSEVIDFDVHIKYTKSYHSLTTGFYGTPESPWLPSS